MQDLISRLPICLLHSSWDKQGEYSTPCYIQRQYKVGSLQDQFSVEVEVASIMD